MGITFPISPSHGQQYTPPGIPVTWQFDVGRNAWRVLRGGTPWTDITGKPATFPPSPHQHPIDDVIDLQDTLDVKQDITARSQPNGYAALDSTGKIPTNQIPDYVITWGQIQDKPTLFPPSAHSHPVAEISDSSSVGQQIVRAPTAANVRTIIGAIGPDDNARVAVAKNGIQIGVRRKVNLIEGTNVTIGVADDGANEKVDVTINSSGGGGGTVYTVSDVKPVAPFDNQLWLDVTTGILFTYYNDGSTSQWIEAIPFLAAMPAAFTKIDFPASPVDGQVFEPITGARWKWSSTRGVWFAVTSVSDAYTKVESDAKFVDLVGDTMTGLLTLSGAPTANLHAATKLYVDNGDSTLGTAVNTKVAKAGDTMTGPLVLSGDATLALHPVTKQQMDAINTALTAAKVAKAGDTMTGDLKISKANAVFRLEKPAAGTTTAIEGDNNGKPRWVLNLGDSAAESGSNVGSEFTVVRFNDAGSYIDTPLVIYRSTGYVAIGNGAGIAQTTLKSNGSHAVLNIDSAAGSISQLAFNRAGLSRWTFQTDGSAESGSNAGTNLNLYAMSDAGAIINYWIGIQRSNGAITLNGSSITVAGGYFGSGDITVTKTNPSLILNKPNTAGQSCGIVGKTAGNLRWFLEFGASAAESGSNAGSDLILHRYADDQTYLGQALSVNRANGVTAFQAAITVAGSVVATGDVYAQSGVLRLNAGGAYLYWDGTNYNLGTGSNSGLIWSNGICPLAGSQYAGYQRLGNGVLIQWGQLSGGDQWISFPTAFPTVCASIHGTCATQGTHGGNIMATMMCSWPSASQFYAQPRYTTGASVAVDTGSVYHWLAVGW